MPPSIFIAILMWSSFGASLVRNHHLLRSVSHNFADTLHLRRSRFNGYTLRTMASSDAKTDDISGNINASKMNPADSAKVAALKRDLVKHVKSRDYKAAMDWYNQMKSYKAPVTKELTSLLSVCYKVDHLGFANEILKDMEVAGIPPAEQSFISLIRCLSDGGKIDEALAVIDDMRRLNVEPKLRTYHPILEAVCHSGNANKALILVTRLLKEEILPRSEQITLLLETALKSGSFNDLDFQTSVNLLLSYLSTELEGLEMDEMRRIVSGAYGSTDKDVQRILIESANVLELGSLAVDPLTGTGTAINSTTNTKDTYILSTAENAPVETNKLVRIVDIKNSTGVCPNCGDHLQRLYLSDEEKKSLRLALLKIASTTSINQLNNLKNYSDWLRSQEVEFKYVVDGANVAYSHQNFDEGRFSYRQIELVVDKLLELNDGRVLVLIPYPYAQKVVPNSSKHKVKGKRKISFTTEGDQRILSRFEENKMLYIVPQGADDDWYWMFTTVAEGRKNPAYVVTNDLMRDHRLAFLEPRPFLRWRTTQVINFHFSRAVVEDYQNPDTTLIPTGKFSREIQQTSSGRWHFPASDRNGWLCLKT